MNFLKIGSQFLMTSGDPVLRMRFFRAADRTKERDIVSSYSPEIRDQLKTDEKSTNTELAKFIVRRDALEYTNETLERECPPRMDRAI